MTERVITAAREETALSVAQTMRDQGVGSVVVCDAQGDPAAIVTDRDLAIRVLADGRDPNSTCVRDAMTPDVAFAFEDDDVQRAAEIMKERQIRRLPVLDRERHLVGIVALGDIATTGKDRLSRDALEQISQPTRSKPS